MKTNQKKENKEKIKNKSFQNELNKSSVASIKSNSYNNEFEK